jgi:phage-related minor tail protein
MALGGAIAEAFVAIRPDTSGFAAGLEGRIKGALSNIPMAGALAGVAVAVGAGLLEVGSKFQASFNAIARGTGATGDQLKTLDKDFKTVLSGTAGSFEQVQAAIIGVSRGTGLVGPPLDALAKQFVTLGRITKTDVAGNIAATEPLFAKFGVTAKNQGAALDVLFKASQVSGLSVADLADKMKTGATILKDFGYTFSSSAALIAEFTKAGVNSDQAISAMKKGFASFAKAGEDPTKAMSALIASIKAAPSEAAATGLALKVFGAKAGPELVAAIRSGKLNVDELTKSIVAGKDGIMATAAATPTLAGAFAKFKNQALVAIEPVATKLLGLVTVLVGKVVPAVQSLIGAIAPVFKTLSALWSDFMNGFSTLDSSSSLGLKGLAATFNDLGATVSKALTAIRPVAEAVFGFLEAHAKPILIGLGLAFVALTSPITLVVGGLIFAYSRFKVFRDVVKSVADFLVNVAAPALKSFYDFMAKALEPLVQTFISRWGEIKTIIVAVVGFVVGWVKLELAVLQEIWSVFHATILRVLMSVWDQVKTVVTVAVRVVADVIKLVLDLLTGHWSKAWHDVLDILSSVWTLIQHTVENAISIVGNLIGSLGGIFLRAMQGAVSAVVNTGAGIMSWFLSLPGKIAGAMAGLAASVFNDMTGVGIAMIQGLIRGIVNMAQSAANAALSVVKSAVNSVKNFLGISSPSTVFHGFGVNLMEGLANGIMAAGHLPGGALGRVSGTLSSAGSISGGIRAVAAAGTNMGSAEPPVIRVYLDGQLGPLVNKVRVSTNTYNQRAGEGR